MNKTFAFRQRAGHLNWKLISSVDIFRIVDELRIDELQSVLDPVAFCEFSVSDVKRNTVDATTKLVHLMQLMIEYLLYCQESQLQLVKDMDSQNHMLRKDLKACTRDNVSYREDIKIYKRQLALLKQALDSGGDYGDQISYRVVNPPINAEHLKPILEPICAMIESVQRHEKETRDYVKSTLDSQRDEFRKLNAENNAQAANGETYTWENVQLALKKQKKEMGMSLKQREAELNERQAELEDRENQLFAAELALQDREAALEKKSPTSTSVGLNTSASIDKGTVKKWNAHFVAMNFLHSTLKSSFFKNVNKYFLRWKMNCWHDKIDELSNKLEECKGELYAASIRETRMKVMLASERQHIILDTAKKNAEGRKQPTKSEIAVMTSLNFDRGELGERSAEEKHHYRSLTWAELASRNQYLSSITDPDDMMRRFERKVEFQGHDIDAPTIDEIFRDLAEEMVSRANNNTDKI